ncbi:MULTISPECIES: hypothetical protein [unclassified Rhodococcus (in: high G+C Gram-positive bacteria)]|uniref:hypothetical protein n=1 Tax=unclassified Rhodococcus (in: high G+C Gram-positive bacteria) TaxID=192944 RepID=UPI00146EE379|nr:hypothetical protein [Rhodococcus sp. HNM0563]NLU62340.1 hypothetical protein [Rhodococcus sp. HNM0563]HET8994149.1 hypothetical protein [Rhodococcus sp. (in: high G+C Gram-positive bacteria)]
MSLRALRRVGAATFVAAGMLTGLAVGTGTAAADTVEVPMDRCWGVSPYILDQPYAPARLFGYQTESGSIQLQMPDVSSLWFFAGGYQTDVKFDWHNIATDERGTLTDTATVAYPGGDVVTFDLNSGPGPVEFTVSAVNSIPLWSIPTTSCGGVVDVW